MSCPHSIRPTCIFTSKLHSGTCIVEIESPLQYARVILRGGGGFKLCRKRPSTTGKRKYQQLWGILTSQECHLSLVGFWDFLKLQGAWCGVSWSYLGVTPFLRVFGCILCILESRLAFFALALGGLVCFFSNKTILLHLSSKRKQKD